MISSAAFTWYHLPRTGGTSTAAWWRSVAKAHGLSVRIDADELPEKHDNALTRALRGAARGPVSKLSVMNFRRLPGWLESSYRFARSQGLMVPEARYLAGEFFSLRAGEWRPADWWLEYFSARDMDLLLPLESLEDALGDVLWRAFGVLAPDGVALPRLNRVGDDIALGAAWQGHDWSEAYRANPVWAELERRVYGQTAAQFSADSSVLGRARQRHAPPNAQAVQADREGPRAGVTRSISALLSEGQFTKALSLAMQELSDTGESHAAHVQVANIEMLLGFLPRAERSWRRALQLEDSAAARLGLGICLFQSGDPLHAITQFRQGLQLDSQSLPLLTAASIATLMVGDFRAASEFAQTALQLAPDDPESMLCLARSRQALGQYEASRGLIAGLERLGHKPDEVALLRAELCCAEGEYVAALSETAALCEQYPDSLTALAAFRKSFAAFTSASTSFAFDEIALALQQPPAPERAMPRRGSGCAAQIDVVMPVHNAPKATERAIRAVLDNSGAALGRLLLVDDASGHETLRLLARFAEAHPSVVLLRSTQRQGFTRTVRLGLEHSDTAAFVALNSDTIVTPGWLERLGGALGSAEDIAMAGPLSNNAAWQNYGAVLDETGQFVSAELPEPDAQALIAAQIHALGAMHLAETGMIHGFCAIVERAKYDAVGGLDAAAFPEGYGEFQDLSYRFRAAGYRLVVALDTVVFHEKGASLSRAARRALSLEGRRTLYERYSAFNYLFVESACAQHKDMAALRTSLERRLSQARGGV